MYNRRVTRIAERTVENESIVNLPNWLSLSFRIDDGHWFDVSDVEILDYWQELNLRQATVTRSLRMQDATGRVTCVEQRHFVSMADPHVAGLETSLRAENWSGSLTVRSGIDGRISNAGVARYSQFDENHLVDVKTCAVNGAIALTARTSQSAACIAEVAETPSDARWEPRPSSSRSN